MDDDSAIGAKRRRMQTAAAVPVLLLACLCCYAFFCSTGSCGIPSVKSLVQRYLTAITDGDIEAAVSLGRGQCGDSMLEDVRADAAELSGAEIRNLDIDVTINSGSDDELRFAHVRFQHRKPDEVGWEYNEMYFASDSQVSVIDLRYLCPMR